MTSQVHATIQFFGEPVEGVVKSPAEKYLYNLPDEDDELNNELTLIPHSSSKTIVHYETSTARFRASNCLFVHKGVKVYIK